MSLADDPRELERQAAADFASSRPRDTAKVQLFAESVYIVAWLSVGLVMVYLWLMGGA